MTCRSQGHGSTPAAEVSRIRFSLHLGKGKPCLDWAWLPRAGELRPSRGLGGSFGRVLSLSRSVLVIPSGNRVVGSPASMADDSEASGCVWPLSLQRARGDTAEDCPTRPPFYSQPTLGKGHGALKLGP